MAKPVIFIFKIILTTSTKYLLILVNIVEIDEFGESKYKNIKKGENKRVEILAKLKIWNLPKSSFANLYRSKQVKNASVIVKYNFQTSSTRKVFTKLR